MGEMIFVTTYLTFLCGLGIWWLLRRRRFKGFAHVRIRRQGHGAESRFYPNVELSDAENILNQHQKGNRAPCLLRMRGGRSASVEFGGADAIEIQG